MRYIKIILFLLVYGVASAEEVIPNNIQNIIDSLQICVKTTKNDSTKATILREIGIKYVNAGNYPKGIETFLKSKDIFQSIKNDYGIFRCDNILGVTYCYMGDYKTALAYVLNAKKGFEDGLIYDNLGLIYYSKNDIVQSLSYYKKALDFYKLKSDKKLVATKLNDVGSLYELLGKSDTAILYYNACLKMSDNKTNLLVGYASLGDLYFKRGKFFLALEFENKSLKLAKQVGDLISVRETENILSDIYLKLGDCKNSLIHYKNYISIKDTLINEDNIKQIVRVEENSKFEKEKEIKRIEQNKKDILQAAQLKSQKFQKNVFIGVSCLVALFLIIAFRGYKKIVQQKKKVVEANKIIEQQKQKIEHEKKEITDNITYAQRIQKAILPSDEYIKNNLPENFLIYKPKDIISGDFYWAYKNSEAVYFATADCTGHGVSGAMMSMIGESLLNETVIEKNITSPELVLDSLREKIIKSINQQGAYEERKDGMDIVFCKIKDMTLECACANNSIYIIRNKVLIEIKSDRFPVGKYITDTPFTLHKIDLQKGDIIYTMSDGFCDQFGEETGKKLMIKRFKEWIIELSSLGKMDWIKLELEQRFNHWKGNTEQIDDVTIFSVKI